MRCEKILERRKTQCSHTRQVSLMRRSSRVTLLNILKTATLLLHVMTILPDISSKNEPKDLLQDYLTFKKMYYLW